MKVSVRKWGNSLALRIPKAVAAEAAVKDGTIADVRVERGMVVARPLAKRLSLDHLLRKVTKQNIHREFFTGRRRGREAW
jgi:antitoxin MazE